MLRSCRMLCIFYLFGYIFYVLSLYTFSTSWPSTFDSWSQPINEQTDGERSQHQHRHRGPRETTKSRIIIKSLDKVENTINNSSLKDLSSSIKQQCACLDVCETCAFILRPLGNILRFVFCETRRLLPDCSAGRVD